MGYTSVGNHSVSKWVDYDNDNDLDVFVAGRTGSSSATAKLYTNVGGAFIDNNIQFGWIENCSADWGDYDNDGDVDLLLCGQGGNTQPVSWIYRNDGNGKFVKLNAGLKGVSHSTCNWIDYDNDSRLDVLLTGVASSRVTKLYRNMGNDVFVEVATNLPNVEMGSVAIGDYDNDGDMDLFLSGLTDGGEKTSNIFRNDGDGKFVKIENNFPKVALGSSAWGDYDNDGNLDLIFTGYVDYNFGSSISEAVIYHNNGNDAFVKINADLAKVYESTVKWVDYDNDGDLDILLAGRYNEASPHDQCYVYRNDGNDTFVLTNNVFPPIIRGDADFGDYDNDGDLDVIISGEIGGASYFTGVFQNQLQGREYIAESAIINPQAIVDKYSVKFSWNSLKFSSTPILGQSYNLQISDTSGVYTAKSACSDISTGRRKIAKPGNIPKGMGWQISKLEGGCYSWSVQAINNAFVGSKFSNGSTFSIVPWPPGRIVPLDSAINQPQECKLSWSIPKAANSYHLQISAQPDFAAPILDSVGVIDTCYAMKNLAYGAKYYWRLNASNAAGTGDWSKTWEFTTMIRRPMIIQPADSEVIKSGKPTLVWNSVSEAESYELDISLSPSFSSYNIVQHMILTDTFFVFSNPLTNKYFWRVRSLKGKIQSAWSPTNFFLINIETDVFEVSVKDFYLLQNYPNPFNPSTTIRFNIPNKSYVNLKVYNMYGQEVAILVDGLLSAGEHSVIFNADGFSSGNYFYRIQAANHTMTRKFLLLK